MILSAILFLIRLNKNTNEIYPDISKVEQKLLPVIQRFNFYYPDYTLPQIYTYISGLNHELPVIAGQDAIAIGLDCYLDTNASVYDLAGIPKYKSMRMQADFFCPPAILLLQFTMPTCP